MAGIHARRCASETVAACQRIRQAPPCITGRRHVTRSVAPPSNPKGMATVVEAEVVTCVGVLEQVNRGAAGGDQTPHVHEVVDAQLRQLATLGAESAKPLERRPKWGRVEIKTVPGHGPSQRCDRSEGKPIAAG